MGRERDQFWAYAVKVNGRFKCNFCEQDFPGGASRIKAHLAGVPGNDIKACNAVPLDVQNKAKATQKKREAQATQETNKKLKSASTSASKLKNKGKEEYMAEVVLNDVVDRLIANAFSLHASEYIGFESSFKAELKNLLETLFKIKFLLDDAQKRQSSDKSVRNWLMDLRDVAYDADNVLDEFSYFWQEVQTQNLMVDQVRSFSFCNPDKVKTIKQLLDKIVHDVAGFGLRMELLNSIPNISLDMNIDPLLDDSEVVGREYDVTKMVNVVISSSNQQVISVLPIVGMAGLGKTTLAKLVYNNELIKKHFDVRAWVNVGIHFNVEGILREILISLEEDLSGLKYDKILQICAEKLRAIKYLLILDDVQDEDLEKWDTLKGYLSKFNSSIGNNIVVTTRSDNVAKIMETHPKHQLEKLSKDDCWSIFKKRTFTNGRIPLTLDLEVIGREIAKRCGGVPCAARVLGGTMSFECDKNKWLEIQNNKIWDLLDEDNSDIFHVLKFCFDHLPTPSLKRCFAYCAIFPKDYDMKKDEVIQYWMAEGFLELAKEVNVVMEDIGNMYFNILLATSFFQNARMDDYGNVISCKMHDLVHDFALSISKSESLILEGDPVDNVSSIQPLFVRFDSKTAPGTSFSGDGFIKVRTLISENFNFDIMLSNFRCLRVLKLSSHGLPDSIEQLIHLRLLDIYQTRELPKSIAKLYNLQTLRIKGRVRVLPEHLSNLINLRHIHINSEFYIEKTPKKMSMLTCLQTLPFFAVGSEDGYRITELGALKNLKGEIVIKNLEYVKDEEEAKSAKLKEKEIFKLGLYWNEEEYCGDKEEEVLEGLQPHPNLKSLTIERYLGKKFPSWVGLSSLYHNLIEINLRDCKECEEVPTLGQLPCLRVLHIGWMSKVRSIGSELYFYSDGSYRNTTLFPALRILKLEWMDSLEEWKDATTADEVLFVFPCLEELTLISCWELRDLPDSLHTCVSLQKLVVEECYELRSLPGVRSIIRSGIEDPQYLENGDCPLPSSSSSTSSIHPSQRVVGLSSLYHNLIEITLYGCSNCEEVPTLGQLPCLRVLEMGGMGKVRCIGSEFYFYSDGSYRNTTLFPALRILKLEWMDSLEEWKDATTADEVLFVFPCLEELTLISCWELRDLPDSLHTCVSLQKLVVEECYELRSLPGVRSIIRSGIEDPQYLENGDCPLPSSSSSTSSIHPSQRVVGLSSLYHNLIEITLYGCSNCEEVPTLGQLPCLRVLEMGGMGKVRCIGSEFYFYSDGSYRNTTLFPALRILKLKCLYDLEEWKDAKVLFVFPCLQELTLIWCKKLRDLPDSLHTCVSLQKLVVEECPMLRSLPGVRSIIRSGIEEPPSGLQYLENGDCRRLPSSSTSSIHPSQRVVGLSSLYHNLIEINLRNCWECEEVPTLGQLPCLRVLEMEGIMKVRCIGSEFYFYSDGSYRITTTKLFPALRILKLTYLRNLEEWKDAKELTTADEVLFVFPCLEELTLIQCFKLRDLPDSLCTCVSLQKLVVQICPMLRSLPGVPSVIRHLEIIECGIDELPSELQLCTSLQYLKIEGCPNLKSIPDLGEVFHSLINLKLINSPDLRLKLPLRRLKTLVIGGFIEELDAFPILRYPFIRYSHASLKRLRLHGSPILNSLPNEIQLFTALEELRIQNFNGMEALPDWFSYLSSLQKLSLYYCKKLMYLPILHLTDLKHLHIARCPSLEKRCAEESSAEWLQMAHIRNIKINENYIKGKDSEDSEDFDDYDDSEDEESDKYDDSEDDRGDYLLEDSIWGNDQFDDN